MNASQTTRTTSGEARRCVPAAVRTGFTLVELMVAITIIAILAAIAVPVTMSVIGQSRDTAIRMELSSLNDAVEKYQQKYNSYPPDGSSWRVIDRHMRRAFPRMAEPDLTLLTNLTHPSGSFSPVAMDRAEALVFFLGGFSSDEAHPLTGQGGPLEYMDTDLPVTDLNAYQYNATRDNAFFDFEPERLPLARAGGRYVSADEQNFGVADAAHGVVNNMPDLLPVYLVDGGEVPIVYFDARTYGDVGGAYNGYLLPGAAGGCRPYKTGFDHDLPSGSTYGSVAAAFNAVKFKNPDTFQIISPGRDGIYGALVETSGGLPVHFVVETGKAVYPNEDASTYEQLQYNNIEGFQEVGAGASENGQYDNITNFSGTTLEKDLAN